jgi:hypothetical protein
MDKRDEFALWIATEVLRANEDALSASALEQIGERAASPQALEAALQEAAAQSRRPGDFGVEFIGPLIPVVLVGFGRLLWDEYVKALAKNGGDALAKLTIEAVKELVRKTWSQDGSTLTVTEAEGRLREAAAKAGLDGAQTEVVLGSLRKPAVAAALTAG